jgi:hypothetical protein
MVGVCLLLSGLRLNAQAKDTLVAVLSSDIGPYQEAFAGFQTTLGQPVETIHMAKESAKVRGEPQIVITFGGKAALQSYPDSSVLLYCMAPGTYIRPGDRQGPSIQVSMMPKASIILRRIKAIQPSAKRIAILWISPANEVYVTDLRKAGKELGIDIDVQKLSRPEDLPNRLRSLQGQTDALWVPPDPLLVNDENLVLLEQFSTSARIPFYSPIAGLTEKGAVATLSSNYGEIGRSAALAVQSILAGSRVPAEVYPEKIEVVINLQAAQKAGLSIDKAVLDQAQKVVP